MNILLQLSIVQAKRSALSELNPDSRNRVPYAISYTFVYMPLIRVIANHEFG